MASHTDSESEILVQQILTENEERNRQIFGTHNQLTGQNIQGHTHRLAISDYPIPVQWLTDEVWNNPIYQDVRKHKTIESLTEYYCNKYPDTEFTEDEVINALFVTRAARDPWFAFYTCFTIKAKKGGGNIPFQLNNPQRYLLAILEEMRLAGTPIRIILLKARQWGGSTLVQLYIAWIQLFVKNGWYSVIIAQTKDTAKRIKAMYKKTLEQIPPFIYNTTQLKFSPYEKSNSDSVITDAHGNIIRDNVVTVASYENFESTRGMDYAMAHFSEVAYWRTTPAKSAENVITNIDSNILEIPLTIEISESTANGMSGYFYDEYQLAKSGKSIRRAVFIPFYYIENDTIRFRTKKDKQTFVEQLIRNKNNTIAPDETSESGQYLYSLWEKGATLEHINWYIRKRKSFHDHAQMASEAPSDDVECFKFSGNRVFNIYLIDTLREQYTKAPSFVGNISQADNTKQPILTPDPRGLLRIWDKPSASPSANRYITIVDVGGRSSSADYSVITVMDRWFTRFTGGKLQVVARWHGHIRYDRLATLAATIARYYQTALLVFESNTFDKKRAEAGEFVEQGDHIRGILTTIGDTYPNLYMRPATNPEDVKNGIYRKIGFQTNVRTKQDMVDAFISTFEDGNFIDPDERFYTEAAIYEQRPDGSYGNIAGRGNHDDILMTDMIGNLVHTYMSRPEAIHPDAELGAFNLGTRNESDL